MKVVQDKTVESILKIDDNFATLVNIESDGTFVYELRYFSSTVQALRSVANTVKITVRRDLPIQNKDVFNLARDSGDYRDFIKGILTADSKTKDAKRNNRNEVIMTVASDLTAKLDNTLTQKIATGLSPAEILGTQKVIDLQSIKSLKQNNINPPVMQTMLFDHANAPTSKQAQRAAMDLLHRGVDPSIAGTKYTCVNGTFKASSGLGHIARLVGNASSTAETTPIAKNQETLVTSLYNVSQKQLSGREDLLDETLVPVMADAPKEQILNFKQIRIPAFDIGLRDFFVVFELVNALGSTLETVTKKVTHSQFVRVFNTPRLPPRVSIAPAQFSGRNVVEIEQIDPRADRVRIMRRVLKMIDLQLNSQYEYVAEISLKQKDGLTKFLDIVNNSSIILYRCIPIGPGGLIGAEFGNSVALPVKPKNQGRNPRTNSATIHTRVVQGGVEISVTSAAQGTVSVGILRRDATLSETEFNFLDVVEPIRSIATGLSSAIFLDDDVKDGHIYEYGCRLYFENGTEVTSCASAIHQYVPLATGAVNIEVSDFQLIHENDFVDVRFNVRSRVSRENLDEVQLALKKQGLSDLFQDELEVERDKLQNLIAHSIVRVDLTRGEFEDFGTFTGTSFADSVIGQKNAVTKLKPGHKYRYIISTLVRKAETMFDKLKRVEEDVSTGKRYQFKPSIFRHPIALSKGTLVTRETLARNHPEDDFSFGKIGNVKEIDVTVDVPSAKIIDVKATRIDRKTASIKWNVEGIHDIEHFVVMKDLLGQSQIVGKSHNVAAGKTFEFLDNIEPDDIGEVSYRVIPVMNNYSRGQSIVSNTIKVVDVRSNSSG